VEELHLVPLGAEIVLRVPDGPSPVVCGALFAEGQHAHFVVEFFAAAVVRAGTSTGTTHRRGSSSSSIRRVVERGRLGVGVTVVLLRRQVGPRLDGHQEVLPDDVQELAQQVGVDAGPGGLIEKPLVEVVSHEVVESHNQPVLERLAEHNQRQDKDGAPLVRVRVQKHDRNGAEVELPLGGDGPYRVETRVVFHDVVHVANENKISPPRSFAAIPQQRLHGGGGRHVALQEGQADGEHPIRPPVHAAAERKVARGLPAHILGVHVLGDAQCHVHVQEAGNAEKDGDSLCRRTVDDFLAVLEVEEDVRRARGRHAAVALFQVAGHVVLSRVINYAPSPRRGLGRGGGRGLQGLLLPLRGRFTTRGSGVPPSPPPLLLLPSRSAILFGCPRRTVF
jgi:hypothetical protein